MTQSIVLFVHIAGVLMLAACLALEAFGVESARNAMPRVSGLALALTLVSGFYLGARFGMLRDDWMWASYAGLVIMAAAGVLGHRSSSLFRLSLAIRTSFGFAIVWLMTAKPNALEALIVLGIAAIGSVLGVVSTSSRHSVAIPRA
jgi:hypothetical protein